MVKKNCLEECNKWCSDQPSKDEYLDASWVNSCKIGCSAGARYQEEDYMDEDDD